MPHANELSPPASSRTRLGAFQPGRETRVGRRVGDHARRARSNPFPRHSNRIIQRDMTDASLIAPKARALQLRAAEACREDIGCRRRGLMRLPRRRFGRAAQADYSNIELRVQFERQIKSASIQLASVRRIQDRAAFRRRPRGRCKPRRKICCPHPCVPKPA